MELYETIFHVLLGVGIGYVLGRFHSYLREIKEELDEVDDIVKRHDESGFMRNPIMADIAVLLAIAICVWAAFSTNSTNNKLENNLKEDQVQQAELLKAQEAIERLSICNQTYLTQTVVALNERTEYAQNRADANVKVVKSESKFWRFLLVEPPPSDEEGRAALERYLVLIDEFVEASERAKNNVVLHPFPTDEDLKSCYDAADKKTEEDKNAAE